MPHKIIKVVVITALTAYFVAAVSAQVQDLPEGAGVDITKTRCLLCHEADLIISQRLTVQGWTREVDKMIRWGAIVPDSERDRLIEYLSVHFPQRPGAAKSEPRQETDRGREIFENRCLICHESDLTEQQRLTRQGWTREVDKMIRWGAVVPDEEKDTLIDYLVAKFGPRP